MDASWIVIGLVGLVALGTRLGGWWLVRLVPDTPFARRFLDHLPGALLVALVLPAFVGGDWRVAVAASATLLLALARAGFVPAMAAGVLLLAVLRAL